MRCAHHPSVCPIMRQCCCCGQVLTTTGRRLRHEAKCREPVNLALSEQQQQHAKQSHRWYRNRSSM